MDWNFEVSVEKHQISGKLFVSKPLLKLVRRSVPFTIWHFSFVIARMPSASNGK
jgi:hypothetical protein